MVIWQTNQLVIFHLNVTRTMLMLIATNGVYFVKFIYNLGLFEDGNMVESENFLCSFCIALILLN